MIDVKDVPTLVGCNLAAHLKSGSCGSRRIGLLMFLQFVLETSQYPSCLCLKEVTMFVHSFGYIISRFVSPQINKIEKFIIQPICVFSRCFASAN